jgi:hypothetical protein
MFIVVNKKLNVCCVEVKNKPTREMYGVGILTTRTALINKKQ